MSSLVKYLAPPNLSSASLISVAGVDPFCKLGQAPNNQRRACVCHPFSWQTWLVMPFLTSPFESTLGSDCVSWIDRPPPVGHKWGCILFFIGTVFPSYSSIPRSMPGRYGATVIFSPFSYTSSRWWSSWGTVSLISWSWLIFVFFLASSVLILIAWSWISLSISSYLRMPVVSPCV